MSLANLRSSYLGALLLTCLVLGGGTQKGLPTVFALELLALPLLLDLLLRRAEQPAFPLPVLVMVGAILGVFALQLLPNLLAPGSLLTTDPGRTLDSLLFTATILVILLSFGRLDPTGRSRMIAWFFTGVILNMALALTQFAASRGLAIEMFPYPLSAGFFANQNHFSSLLYVAIPFVVYQFDAIDRLPWAALVVGLIVFVEFAAGSVAGVGLSLASALVSLAIVGRVPGRLRAILLTVSALGAVILALNPGNVLGIKPDDPLDRPTIALSTLRAIGETLPLGSGYGTFDIVYPSVEADTDIRGTYINHAHNEALELVLEGGLPAALLIAAYLVLLAWRLPAARRSSLAMAALCGIVFVLIHSLVDYPLRTAALAVVFALCNAIYFGEAAPSGRSSRPRRSSSRAVRVTSG